MLGEPENQFSLTRAALSAGRRAKSKLLSVCHFQRVIPSHCVVVTGIGLVLMGCTTPIPPAPKDQLAILDVTHGDKSIYVKSIDGRRARQAGDGFYYLSPGPHQVKCGYSGATNFLSRLVSTNYPVLLINAKGRYQYHLENATSAPMRWYPVVLGEPCTLNTAVEFGVMELAQALLKENPASVSMKDGKGNTPLHLAAQYGQTAAVELLLLNNADVNAKNQEGDTPLHGASGARNTAAVELLLRKNADVNAKNQEGVTPLHRASNCRNAAVVESFLRKNADVNARDSRGDTPLHNASFIGDPPTMKLLLLKNADVNAKNNEGETPLHRALFFLHQKAAVECLLLANADVNAKSNKGETPLHIAVRHKEKGVARLLRQHGGLE